MLRLRPNVLTHLFNRIIFDLTRRAHKLLCVAFLWDLTESHHDTPYRNYYGIDL